MAEKKKSSPKRAEARAASRRRGVQRHERNRMQNTAERDLNGHRLAEVSYVTLSAVQTTYGPATAKYGKPKRPSKVLRSVRRLTDPKVAAKRAAHIASS